jgi:hypothetical protein
VPERKCKSARKARKVVVGDGLAEIPNRYLVKCFSFISSLSDHLIPDQLSNHYIQYLRIPCGLGLEIQIYPDQHNYPQRVSINLHLTSSIHGNVLAVKRLSRGIRYFYYCFWRYVANFYGMCADLITNMHVALED